MYNAQNSTRYAAAPTATESGLGRSAEVTEDEYVLSVRDLIQVIWKRLWLILLVMVMLVGVAVGFGLMQTPMYESSIKILVGQERGITENPNDVMGLQQLTQTMAEGVNSRPVAENVIRQLGLQMSAEDFLASFSVEQITRTQFIQVNYRDPSPEQAQLVANTIGEVFSEEISNVSPSANTITATVWERAEVPRNPASPNFVLYIGVALMLGLMLGVGLAFLLEYLDESWGSPEEIERFSGVPTFAVIPEFTVLAGKKKVRY